MSTRKLLQNELRGKWLLMLSNLLESQGEQVLRVKSNEIAIPTTDSENNEEFIVITVKIPTGTRNGELYDGFEMADDYQLKLIANSEKAKERQIKKERKIEQDKKRREHQKKLKEKKEG